MIQFITMPRKDPNERRVYQRNYMRERYHTDPTHRRKQIIRSSTKSLKSQKPSLCEMCASPNPEAHHPDYERPSLIRWLCRVCHMAMHANQNTKSCAVRRHALARYLAVSPQFKRFH